MGKLNIPMMSKDEIRVLILTKAPFSKEENMRIYNKFFKPVPKSLIIPLRKYMLGSKKVLDVGCSYGHYLIHFGEGSVGLDAIDHYCEFGKAIGLDIRKCNVEVELPVENVSFDAVWCSALLEHVVAPHLLLLRFHKVLKDDGLLFINVPTVPPNIVLEKLIKIAQGHIGYKAVEHINAFTKKTLEFTIERAGYKIIEINTSRPVNALLNKITNPILIRCGLSVTVIAKKDPNFRYPEKRVKAFTPAFMINMDDR